MTSHTTVFDQLARHPFMAGLPAAWLQRLAAHGRQVTWPATSRLLRVGSPADQFWLLSSGVVELDFRLPGRDDVPIERIGAGDLLGWSWLTYPYRSALGASAVEQCEAIELRAAPIRTMVSEDPAFGLTIATRVLAVAENHLRTARLRFIELAAQAGPARPGRMVSGGVRCTPNRMGGAAVLMS